MTQLFDDTSDVSVGGGVAETEQKKICIAAFDFHLDESQSWGDMRRDLWSDPKASYQIHYVRNWMCFQNTKRMTVSLVSVLWAD